jgi:phosphoacetylglucosamine mutase
MIIRMDLDMTVHKKGVEAIRGTMAHDMGVLTTPQLHWMVRSFNNGVPASE